MNFIVNYFKGVAIGAGASLPGLSSGVLCVIFGIYDKLLDCVLNFFKDVKNNFKFLLPIGLGGICGIVLFGNFLNVVFERFPLQTKCIFIGLILGSIPSLFKEVHQKQKFKPNYLIFLVLSLALGIFMVWFENFVFISSSDSFSFVYLILAGFFMSVGVIVPGVSSTVILMLLGVYSIYLSAVSTVYLPVLIPMAIGLFIGSLLFMKLTRFLLDNFYAPTFYSIIGFTIGSIFVLFPSISGILDGLIAIFCILLGLLFFQFLEIDY